MKKYLLFICIFVFLLAGCTSEEKGSTAMGYKQISQDEAKEMMKKDDGHIIVDVRREDEYIDGHIPSAICIPNESIGTGQPAELPDLDQIILIYCRSGNRSKQAAKKLADIGYTNLYEFGGITTWTGDIVVDDSVADAIRPRPTLVIEANGHVFYADLEDNPSADEFTEKLSKGSITVELHDYGNFEKVGPLPWELVRSDESITTRPGDVILYEGDQITIYYDQNTWDFTRLARIGNTSKEKLLDILGEGDVTVTFSIEWSE